ncbi:hypothetical protein AB9K41_07920 [Cribrihabitans sp. XS_ASV171]
MLEENLKRLLDEAHIKTIEARGIELAIREIAAEITGGQDLTEDRIEALQGLAAMLLRLVTETGEMLDPSPSSLAAA